MEGGMKEQRKHNNARHYKAAIGAGRPDRFPEPILIELPNDHKHDWVKPINGLHQICRICHWRLGIDETALPPDGAPELQITE